MQITFEIALKAVRAYFRSVEESMPTTTLGLTGGLPYFIPTVSFDYEFTDGNGKKAILFRVHPVPKKGKGTLYIVGEDPDVLGGYILHLVFEHTVDELPFSESFIKETCDAGGIFSTTELTKGTIPS